MPQNQHFSLKLGKYFTFFVGRIEIVCIFASSNKQNKKEMKQTIKILSNGIFTAFSVRNKYRISKTEQSYIFEKLGVSNFEITFPKTTHSYSK